MPGTPFEVLGVKGELHPIRPDGRNDYGGKDWSDEDVPFGARTAYAVIVDGERIGVVSSKRGTSHRKAGRIITHTSHPTEWVATLTGFYRRREGLGYGDWQPREGSEGYSTLNRCAGDWFRGRVDATRRLVEAWRDAQDA